jgi:hypothetical protein
VRSHLSVVGLAPGGSVGLSLGSGCSFIAEGPWSVVNFLSHTAPGLANDVLSSVAGLQPGSCTLQ